MHTITSKDYFNLATILNYSFEDFLRRVCDYEYTHQDSEELMTTVVLGFKALKEASNSYVNIIHESKEFLEYILNKKIYT